MVAVAGVVGVVVVVVGVVVVAVVVVAFVGGVGVGVVAVVGMGVGMMAATLDHALAYAARGWRVAPLQPGHKHPSIRGWQDAATTDAERIRRYWDRHPAHGVCIVTGAGSDLFAVDIDPDDGGDDSLRALETVHGPLPDTVQSLTGGGGTHYLFRWPTDGREVRNSASGVLGVGIDIRGAGGQIVAPPTVHPDTHRRYEWEVEHDPLEGQAVAEAPEWLLDLLTTPPGGAEPRRERRQRPVGDVLPGDWWAAGTTWPDELQRRGWSLHSTHADAAGDHYELWTRPGKRIDEGASASLYWRGSDVLKVFTSGASPLRADETYTLWGFEVAYAYGGDFTAAASAVRGEMQIAAGLAAIPPAPVSAPPRTVVGVACPACRSTNTRPAGS